MNHQAYIYLDTALTIIAQHACARDTLDWHGIRQAAFQRATDAETWADTYATIRWVLGQTGDRHSFFAPPESGDAAIASGRYDQEATIPSGHLRADHIALLAIPAFRGAPHHSTRYATTLQATIAQLDAQHPIGWMIDLTDNSGGNMWPMLAGLGPLLGEGLLGGFAFPNQPLVHWFYRAGQAGLGEMVLAQTTTGGYTLQTQRAPLALLISPRTASSGEAVVLAFAGCPEMRRFGTATRGLTTANESYPLVDDAMIVLTVATFVDRIGQVAGTVIEPDEIVAGDTQAVAASAAAWIHAYLG